MVDEQPFHELASGRHPFLQDTAALTSNAIQTAEPGWLTANEWKIAEPLGSLLRSMLAKDRDRIVGLFRRGRIDEAALDKELDLIDAESAGLQAEIEQAVRVLNASDRDARFRSAEELLKNLA